MNKTTDEGRHNESVLPMHYENVEERENVRALHNTAALRQRH